MVISGSGRKQRKVAKVIRVLPDRQRVLVEGVNVHKKHLKPKVDKRYPQGGVIEKEMPIHISNVMPVSDGKPTRVRFETRDDGSKVRVSAKTGQALGAPLRKPKQNA